MRVVDLSSWPRRELFAKFGAFRYPHFNVCAPVEVTALLPAAKQRGASLSAAIIYVVTRAANDIPEFRYRIRGDTVVEHEVVHPSVTALVPGDLFSFAQVEYSEDFPTFAARLAARLAQVKEEPTLTDEPGRDDLLFMTALPWVSFTSFSHPMPSLPADSFPRFAWGKIYPEGGAARLPLSVQGHHALMDGIHLGRCFEKVQGYLAEPAAFLGSGKAAPDPGRPQPAAGSR